MRYKDETRRNEMKSPLFFISKCNTESLVYTILVLLFLNLILTQFQLVECTQHGHDNNTYVCCYTPVR